MKQKLLLLMIGVLSALPVLARDFKYTYEKQTLDYTIIDEDARTCKVSGYEGGGSEGISGALVIPDFAKDGTTDYHVISIGESVFYGCRGLTSVVIPNSVTEIGQYAFNACSGLTSIVIPNSVTEIGGSAFYGCTGLTSVVIPNSVISIGGMAFGGCSGLTSVMIGNSVETIGKYAFSDCSGLTSVMIGNSVETIGEYAFSDCSGLTSVVIGNSVETIGEYAFSGCSGLTSVVIPNSVTEIGNRAFEGCDGLESLAFYADNCETCGSDYFYSVFPSSLKSLEIGDNVTRIPAYAFTNCSGLTSVVIPNSVTSIGEQAFYDCSGLTSVMIGNSVETIGEYAFHYCSGLTSVVIPNSVTEIGYGAFSSCSSLTKAEFSSIESLCNINFGNSYANPLYEAHCLYIDGKEVTEVVIPETVTSIGSYTFAGCSGLTSVVIPNSVQTIGSYAFSESGLISVVIPGSITSISQNTFLRCKELKSVVIGNKVTSIGESAFTGCSGLTSVVIPNSVTEIGYAAFSGCSGLTKAEFPSIESLCNINFGGLSNPLRYAHCLYIDGKEVTEVVIPETVTSIGNYTFDICSGLTSVVIPNSVTSIGEGAFFKCDGLTSVVIPNSVTSIGESAFERCSGLTSVVIGDSVTEIGEFAFSGCSSLTKAEFSSIESLCNITFGGANANPLYYAHCLYIDGKEVTEVVIPETVTSIGSYAFAGCSGLTKVTALPIRPAVMDDKSFEGLYDKVSLSVPDEAVNSYLATNWSLFNNIQDNSGKGLEWFSDGEFEYRINPADMTAMIIGAKNYSDLQIPARFTDDSDPANPVRYYIKGIGYNAFNGKGVNSVEFNSRSQMEYLGNYAFAGTNISSISLPATLRSIGGHAFAKASGLSKVEFNEGLESIGDYAFAESGLTSISIPGSVSAIGKYAFYKTGKLTEVEIKEGVASIGDYAFANSGLASISIPGSVSAIGTYAFYKTQKLSGVELKEGLASIGDYAFSADKERSVTGKPLYLPSTVNSVGAHAFQNFVCSQVDISDLNAWLNIDFGNYLANPLCVSSDGLYVNGEKLTSLKVPESIKEIKPYAFYNCKSLEEVTFPEGLEKIGTYSFRYCDNVTEVTIPASVEEIGRYVFGQSNVTFADGLMPISFGEGAFYNSNGLTDLKWGRPVESLTLNIDNVTSLGIGNLITEIPDGRFKDLKNLKSLSLGSSIRTIGNNAFSGCTGLAEVILPPYVETIGASAFAGDSNLESIIMGHSVKTIGEKAFDGCKANTVSITAQTPPTAPNNTFSNYKGMLYLQGKTAYDAYYDVFTCWDRFESTVMIEPTGIEMKGVDNISGKPGDTFRLTAKLIPENVTLPQIFWRSTNPDVATVDANGLVTLHAENVEMATRAKVMASCKIIAESLYADGPVAEVTLTGEVDEPIFVESLTIDPTEWSGVEGSEFKITASVLPEDAKNKTLKFVSSDTSVATVDAAGNVKVLKEGSCVITVATTDGSKLTAECMITSLSGVDAIFADPSAQVDVYDMNGVMLMMGCSREELKQLKPAIYIIRSGEAVVKMVVR